jgi:hypothetical protein
MLRPGKRAFQKTFIAHSRCPAKPGETLCMERLDELARQPLPFLGTGGRSHRVRVWT